MTGFMAPGGAWRAVFHDTSTRPDGSTASLWSYRPIAVWTEDGGWIPPRARCCRSLLEARTASRIIGTKIIGATRIGPETIEKTMRVASTLCHGVAGAAVPPTRSVSPPAPAPARSRILTRHCTPSRGARPRAALASVLPLFGA